MYAHKTETRYSYTQRKGHEDIARKQTKSKRRVLKEIRPDDTLILDS